MKKGYDPIVSDVWTLIWEVINSKMYLYFILEPVKQDNMSIAWGSDSILVVPKPNNLVNSNLVVSYSVLGQNRWITLACQLPFILCTYLQIGHFTHTLKPTCSASRCLSVHLPSYNGAKKIMNQNFHFYKAKSILQTKIKNVWQSIYKPVCSKSCKQLCNQFGH